MQVLGWVGPVSGIGGITSGILPAWLGEPLTAPVLWFKPPNPAGCFAAADCVWLFVHIRPGSKADFGPPARWVVVTGHFDDPTAKTCRWDGRTSDPVTPQQAVKTCRDAFVATAVRDAAAP